LISILYFAPDGSAAPDVLRQWFLASGMPVATMAQADEVVGGALRTRPRVIAVDSRTHPVAALKLVRRLKLDSFTGVIPCVVVCGADDDSFAAAFDAGADEVLRADVSAIEGQLRLDLLLRRSDRDTLVHPSTRLPGAIEIETELTRRLRLGELFAMCYADLDHFKEFNDRYSYYDGDRVIRILSKILHDVVKGVCGERGFVGHIGGDDFIFVVPVDDINETCAEIVEIFDLLIPFQYSDQDRRAGYFFGKDRRGQLHKVPLMTVSIGVVTNERRSLTTAHQVSELATEMKSYAKTLPGSVFTVDRRTDAPVPSTGADEVRESAGGAREEL
jgi:diguanylate cyclase (GGDEF)-like protein